MCCDRCSKELPGAEGSHCFVTRRTELPLRTASATSHRRGVVSVALYLEGSLKPIDYCNACILDIAAEAFHVSVRKG